MAKSRYEYVKTFETDDRLLPGCWIVVRIDGRQFRPYVYSVSPPWTRSDPLAQTDPSSPSSLPPARFTDAHAFHKPQDDRGIDLMNRCAAEVMRRCPDIVLAIGASDEFSFVIRKESNLFTRRAR